MKISAGSGAIAAVSVALVLAGCSTRLGGFNEPEPPPVVVEPAGPAVGPGPGSGLPPTVAVSLPAMTADGTQQFVVPPAGRGVLRNAVVLQLREPISDARVSNGWRTAAGAQHNPNDYAACIAAITGSATRYFVIVVSGSQTSGIVTGAQGQQKCTDANRVVQWLPFPEATKVE